MSTKDNEAFAVAHGALNAFLDRGAAFEGKLTFQGVVRIDGKFSGDIMSDDTLLLGSSGRVKGKVTVGEADISGHFDGTLNVLGTTYLRPTASFEGELTTGRLVVEDGAEFNGRIAMQTTDPTDQARQLQEEVERTLA